MKIKEIREKNDEALEHELRDQQKHLFDLRSQAVTEKLEDPSQLLKVRRDIARMKTVLRQRQIEGTNGKQQKSEKRTEPKTAKKRVTKRVTKTVKKKTARKRTKTKAKAPVTE